MSDKILRARAFIKRNQIRLTYMNPELSYFVFKIKLEDQEIIITKNFKGWLCDYIETEAKYQRRVLEAKVKGYKTGKKWGCALNPNTECIHILASKMWLEILNSEAKKSITELQTNVRKLQCKE